MNWMSLNAKQQSSVKNWENNYMAIQFEVPKVNKKIVAIDFDGVIVDNNYPMIGHPNIDIIAFIRRHRKRYTWILWTCRVGDKLQEAIDYMKCEHGITFDYVNENCRENILKYGSDSRKVYADFYLDDHNIDFERMI